MAGGPGLFGMPLSTGSAVTPTDYSPWMRALDRIQQQHNQQQQFGLRQQQLGEQSRRFDVSRGDEQERFQLEFGRSQELEQRRRKERRQDITREQEGIEAERDWRGQLRQDTLEQREYQREQDEREQERGVEKETRQRQRTEVATRAASIISQNLPNLADEMREQLGRDPTPQELRDAMLAETGKLEGEDRAAVQAAIQAWYDDAVEAEESEYEREVDEEKREYEREYKWQYEKTRQRTPLMNRLKAIDTAQRYAEDILVDIEARILGLKDLLGDDTDVSRLEARRDAAEQRMERLEAERGAVQGRLAELDDSGDLGVPPGGVGLPAGAGRGPSPAPQGEITADGIRGLTPRAPAKASTLDPATLSDDDLRAAIFAAADRGDDAEADRLEAAFRQRMS